jgi:dihydroxy-acid dehydratase
MSAEKVADTREHSRLVVDGLKQTAARAMLRAVGFGDADFEKPQIGVASTWARLTPCNMHIRELAEQTVAGVDGAGGKSVLFNTITVSDGISMGSPGMRYSLVSREVIADSIETVVAAEGFDGVVAIGGCDKNMPGCAMAIARLNRPGVFVYGGTIRPGAQRRDIVTVFEAIGARAAGRIDDAELREVELTAIPGAGSCGGMYTANTMASAIEALGLSLPNSSAQEAVGEAKRHDCRRAGEAVMHLLKAGIRPRDILTRKAFENAITVTIALSGSTNAVLHLLAIARDARIKLHLDDFTRIGRRVPVLADLRPSGRYLMSDLIGIGGIQPLMKILLDAGYLHGECMTVTGATVAANLADVAPYPAGQDIIRPLAKPLKKDSHLVVHVRQSGARRGGGEDHRPRGARVQRPRPGVRRRRARNRGDSWRRRARRRRRRDPLRGSEGRPGNARDALSHGCALRPRARRQGGAHHGRTLLRRQSRLCGWTYCPRGRRRRADCAPARRRPHQH